MASWGLSHCLNVLPLPIFLLFSIIVFINWLYRLKCIVKTKKGNAYNKKGAFLDNIRKDLRCLNLF